MGFFNNLLKTKWKRTRIKKPRKKENVGSLPEGKRLCLSFDKSLFGRLELASDAPPVTFQRRNGHFGRQVGVIDKKKVNAISISYFKKELYWEIDALSSSVLFIRSGR